jgi:hypothetical protein
MAADIATLNFLAPALANVPEDEKQQALDMATAYRPACLTPAKQDEAQVWYAAWLLYDRLLQTQEIAPGISFTGVTSMREGDVQIAWGKGQARTDGISDPLGFYGRWEQLNKLCGYGAITVAPPTPGCCCG